MVIVEKRSILEMLKECSIVFRVIFFLYSLAHPNEWIAIYSDQKRKEKTRESEKKDLKFNRDEPVGRNRFDQYTKTPNLMKSFFLFFTPSESVFIERKSCNSISIKKKVPCHFDVYFRKFRKSVVDNVQNTLPQECNQFVEFIVVCRVVFSVLFTKDSTEKIRPISNYNCFTVHLLPLL